MARSKPAAPAAAPMEPMASPEPTDADFDNALAALDGGRTVTVVEDAPQAGLSAQTLAEMEAGRRKVQEHAEGAMPTIDLEAGEGFTTVDTKD